MMINTIRKTDMEQKDNVYNRVVIDLTTHDAGGIGALDIELAKKIDAL